GPGVIKNNLLVGSGNDVPKGYGPLNEGENTGNLVAASAALANPDGFDIHLRPGSPAIGIGLDPAAVLGVPGFRLDHEYVHPLHTGPRPPGPPFDAGAGAPAR